MDRLELAFLREIRASDILSVDTNLRMKYFFFSKYWVLYNGFISSLATMRVSMASS